MLFRSLDRRDHTVQIVFDAVCHSTVRFVQMADGHAVADITKNDAGQLKLIILHVRGGVHTKNSVAVNGAADNDQGIHNAAVPHEKQIGHFPAPWTACGPIPFPAESDGWQRSRCETPTQAPKR